MRYKIYKIQRVNDRFVRDVDAQQEINDRECPTGFSCC